MLFLTTTPAPTFTNKSFSFISPFTNTPGLIGNSVSVPVLYGGSLRKARPGWVGAYYRQQKRLAHHGGAGSPGVCAVLYGGE